MHVLPPPHDSANLQHWTLRHCTQSADSVALVMPQPPASWLEVPELEAPPSVAVEPLPDAALPVAAAPLAPAAPDAALPEAAAPLSAAAPDTAVLPEVPAPLATPAPDAALPEPPADPLLTPEEPPPKFPSPPTPASPPEVALMVHPAAARAIVTREWKPIRATLFIEVLLPGPVPR
jgi:hypothetical protein